MKVPFVCLALVFLLPYLLASYGAYYREIARGDRQHQPACTGRATRHLRCPHLCVAAERVGSRHAVQRFSPCRKGGRSERNRPIPARRRG